MTTLASRDEFTFADVTVVMPTYNEAAAVVRVLKDIDRVTDGAARVICVDGSSDATPELARQHGATVIEQSPQGYGVALRAGVAAAERPIVMTADCDDTYPMSKLPEFLAAINEGYDVVSGDRLSGGGAGAMPAFNRLGNRIFAGVASLLVGSRIRDTTTGMRAYRRTVLTSMAWTENPGLSAELLLRPIMRGYRVRELAIPYDERAGESKLDPVADGARIAGSILKVGVQERLGARDRDEGSRRATEGVAPSKSGD